MAEQGRRDSSRPDGREHAEEKLYLEEFIASQMQQQEKTSKESDNLDTAKRDNFIARALSESRRMNMEVEKSRKKSENLHAELGGGRIMQWRNEHSAEVLQTQQTELANLTSEHG